MWSALAALAASYEGLSLSLTPLERCALLTALSSLSPADLWDFETEAEAQEARDTFDTVIAKLIGALNA